MNNLNEDVAIAMGWVFGENEYGVKGWTSPSGARCGGLPDFLHDAGQIPILMAAVQAKCGDNSCGFDLYRDSLSLDIYRDKRQSFFFGKGDNKFNEALCNAVVAMEDR